MPFKWYVAQTHTLAEHAAVRRLKQQDFETYLPHMRLRRPERRGRLMVHRYPLFAGYFFVRLDVEDDAEERWKRVNSTRAILSLLPRSDHPLPMRPGQVEDLQEAELAGNFVYPRSDAIRRGTRLRIDVGPLAQQVVECLAADDRRGIVQALWGCFSRQTTVTLPLESVTVLRSSG